MTRTTIKQTDYNEVTLKFVDEFDNPQERVFFVTSDFGYVRERTADGRDPQVCKRLERTGSTLQCSPSGLIDVIRSEWKARRAQEKTI